MKSRNQPKKTHVWHKRIAGNRQSKPSTCCIYVHPTEDRNEFSFKPPWRLYLKGYVASREVLIPMSNHCTKYLYNQACVSHEQAEPQSLVWIKFCSSVLRWIKGTIFWNGSLLTRVYVRIAETNRVLADYPNMFLLGRVNKRNDHSLNQRSSP